MKTNWGIYNSINISHKNNPNQPVLRMCFLKTMRSTFWYIFLSSSHRWVTHAFASRVAACMCPTYSCRSTSENRKIQSYQLPIKNTHPPVIYPSVEIFGKAYLWADSAQEVSRQARLSAQERALTQKEALFKLRKFSLPSGERVDNRECFSCMYTLTQLFPGFTLLFQRGAGLAKQAFNKYVIPPGSAARLIPHYTADAAALFLTCCGVPPKAFFFPC